MIQRDTEVTEGRYDVGGIRVGIVQRRNGEISVKDVVNESRVAGLRRVTDGEGRDRRFNEIRMDVFRLITILEDEILKERIRGKRGGEEVG